MKRLIATRPIQYMGRTYEAGANIPAHDGRMREAWLAAGSARWTVDEPTAAVEAVRAAAQKAKNNDQATDILRDLGVTIENDAGEFVGADNLLEQIRTAITDDQSDAQEDTDNQEGENGKNAGAPELLTGHLDTAQLERMTRADLTKLSSDLGVDISAAKNNAERAAILAAVPVQAPNDNSGGTQ